MKFWQKKNITDLILSYLFLIPILETKTFNIFFYKTATNDNLFLTQDIYNEKSLVMSLSPRDKENTLPVFVKSNFFPGILS